MTKKQEEKFNFLLNDICDTDLSKIKDTIIREATINILGYIISLNKEGWLYKDINFQEMKTLIISFLKRNIDVVINSKEISQGLLKIIFDERDFATDGDFMIRNLSDGESKNDD